MPHPGMGQIQILVKARRRLVVTKWNDFLLKSVAESLFSSIFLCCFVTLRIPTDFLTLLCWLCSMFIQRQLLVNGSFEAEQSKVIRWDSKKNNRRRGEKITTDSRLNKVGFHGTNLLQGVLCLVVQLAFWSSIIRRTTDFFTVNGFASKFRTLERHGAIFEWPQSKSKVFVDLSNPIRMRVSKQLNGRCRLITRVSVFHKHRVYQIYRFRIRPIKLTLAPGAPGWGKSFLISGLEEYKFGTDRLTPNGPSKQGLTWLLQIKNQGN